MAKKAELTTIGAAFANVRVNPDLLLSDDAQSVSINLRSPFHLEDAWFVL